MTKEEKRSKLEDVFMKVSGQFAFLDPQTLNPKYIEWLEDLMIKSETLSPLEKLHDWCEKEGNKEDVELVVRSVNMNPIIVDCSSRSSVSEFKDHITEQ